MPSILSMPVPERREREYRQPPTQNACVEDVMLPASCENPLSALRLLRSRCGWFQEFHKKLAERRASLSPVG